MRKVMKYNKYSAKKTTVDGIMFDSKAEAERFEVLKVLQNSGEIGDITVHPIYVLVEGGQTASGVKLSSIKYEADFKYYDMKLKKYVIEDVKGFATPTYKIKRNLFLRQLPQGHIFMEIK